MCQLLDRPWPGTYPLPGADLNPMGRPGNFSPISTVRGEQRDAIARIETLGTGKTLRESHIDIDDVIAVFRYYANLIGSAADRVVDTGNPAVISRIVREPVGVCVEDRPGARGRVHGGRQTQ